jgi:hypothetical protein
MGLMSGFGANDFFEDKVSPVSFRKCDAKPFVHELRSSYGQKCGHERGVQRGYTALIIVKLT